MGLGATGFAAELADTIVDDAAMHRPWYDLRATTVELLPRLFA